MIAFAHFFVSLVLGAVGAEAGVQPLSSAQFGVRAVEVPHPEGGIRARGVDTVTSHVMTIQKTAGRSPGHSWLNSMRAGTNNHGNFMALPPNSTRLTYFDERQYIGNISMGNQQFQVTVDSGSADTWVVQKGFKCVDEYGQIAPEQACNFGPAFNGTFQHGAVSGVVFSISYGDGEFLRGPSGHQDVTVAGITVKKQQVSLVDTAFWFGDGTGSGLLGLGYPFITRVFNSSSAGRMPNSPGHRKYDPIFTTMHKQRLVSPMFSMAMNRTSHTGTLAFGGLPEVDHEPEFARTPIRMADIYNISSMSSEYSFYTIIADSYEYANATNSTKVSLPRSAWNDLHADAAAAGQFPAVVDSGTSLMYLPGQIVKGYAALFDPPAKYSPGTDQYWAPCDAPVPKFSVVIGGKAFPLNAADLVQGRPRVPGGGSDSREYCLIGIADGGPGPYLLGDVFMNNVLSVFDVGAGEMRFARTR